MLRCVRRCGRLGRGATICLPICRAACLPLCPPLWVCVQRQWRAFGRGALPCTDHLLATHRDAGTQSHRHTDTQTPAQTRSYSQNQTQKEIEPHRCSCRARWGGRSGCGTKGLRHRSPPCGESERGHHCSEAGVCRALSLSLCISVSLPLPLCVRARAYWLELPSPGPPLSFARDRAASVPPPDPGLVWYQGVRRRCNLLPPDPAVGRKRTAGSREAGRSAGVAELSRWLALEFWLAPSSWKQPTRRRRLEPSTTGLGRGPRPSDRPPLTAAGLAQRAGQAPACPHRPFPLPLLDLRSYFF